MHFKQIWGKVIGGTLGLALGGGPLGALLGMIVGHVYDTRREYAEAADPWDGAGFATSGNKSTVQQMAFTKGVVTLGAKMAKADGRVVRAEIEAFKRAFQVKKAQEDYIGKIFDSARKSADDFEPFAFQLAQTFNNRPIVLEQILYGLFIIAGADAEGQRLVPAEARFLKQVAYIFNFGPDAFKRISAQAGILMPDEDSMRESARETATDPFAVLDISSKSNNDEIKSAYRNLIRKHHPDKLLAEGMPPEFIAMANEKMKRINAAYDAVCKVRGIK